jgi:hypothetical protein
MDINRRGSAMVRDRVWEDDATRMKGWTIDKAVPHKPGFIVLQSEESEDEGLDSGLDRP